jgi:Ca-activated chloride channel homolog
MSFASPPALLALGLIPLAVAAYRAGRRRAGRYAVRFPGVPTLAAILPAVPAWRRHLPAGLFLIALAALTASLARPQVTVAVPVERATVVLVTDASRSMLATDVEPSRLEAVQEAAHSFVDGVPDGVRLGAVAFSEAPHTVEAPTTELDEVRATLDGLVADGGTGTGEALATALTLVEEDRGQRRPPAAIVLLSDGETTTGRDPVGVARQAGRQRIPIYTVALGTSSGVVPTPGGGTLPVPPDPETMRQIASVSDGRSFEVDDGDELNAVYEDLGSRIATRDEERELTAAFAGGGALLLLAAAGAALRSRGRLP